MKSFNENSDNQLIKKVKDFEKRNNPKGYVIDVRNNPGGLLTQAIRITDFFLDDGEIVSTRGRKKNLKLENFLLGLVTVYMENLL